MSRKRRGAGPKQDRSIPIRNTAPGVQTLFDEALGHHQAGRLAEAEGLYRQILTFEPRHAGGLHLLGVIALQVGRNDIAIELIGQALAIDGATAPPHSNLGLALRELGRLEEAEASFRRALDIDPGNAEAHTNLGVIMQGQERPEEAEASHRRAIELRPDMAVAHANLGVVLQGQGRLDEAEASHRNAIAINPSVAQTHTDLGNVLNGLGRLDEAEASHRMALHLDANHSWAHNNLGVVLRKQGRLDEAAASHRRAIEITPGNAEAHTNLGVVLQDLGRWDEAEESHRKAIELKPDGAEIHDNLSLVLLGSGKFAEGWREHEWRFRTNAHPLRPFVQPRWRGEDLRGRKVLVWGELGVGDEIFFFAFLPELLDLGAELVVECDARLVPILGRSLPRVEAVARRNPPDPRCLVGDIDFQIPAASVGALLRPTSSDLSPFQPYLQSDPTVTAALRAKYGGGEPLVGISWWSGNGDNGRLRTLPLGEWKEILTLPGLRFITLQYGDHAAEIEAIRRDLGVEIILDPDIDPLLDLDAFAAQVAAMDLIVSVDNSTVHMAGALGKPVWAMLSSGPDWRWMSGRDDSPWYPSIRLFRQPEAGDWISVTEKVKAELRRLVASP